MRRSRKHENGAARTARSVRTITDSSVFRVDECHARREVRGRNATVVRSSCASTRDALASCRSTRGPTTEAAMDDELRFHVERLRDRHVANRLLEELGNDLQYAVRQVKRSPG